MPEPRLTPESIGSKVFLHKNNVQLAGTYDTSTQAFQAVPAGARRVTFLIAMQKGAGASNQARVAVEWRQQKDELGGQRDFREPVIDPSSFAVTAAPEAKFNVHQGAWLLPVITFAAMTGVLHLTFEVPEGVESVRMLALESGTPGTPPNMTVEAVFSGMM